MQDRTLKTELVITNAKQELNVFEQFLDEILKELGIGEKSEGILLGALLGGYELFSSTLMINNFALSVVANHNGVFFRFILDENGYRKTDSLFSNSFDDANVQKMSLLSERLELIPEKHCLSLEFERNNIFSKIANERSSLLKNYFRSNISEKNLKHDHNRRD